MVWCILQWSPGHSKISGNVKAHELAQKATLPECTAPSFNNPILLLSTIKEIAGTKITAPDSRATFTNAKVGRFIKSFDKALPGKHTKTIYNGRSKKQAQILCQMRTGISRLNSYLTKIQAADSAQCRCNRGNETVDHFLFRCTLMDNRLICSLNRYKSPYGSSVYMFHYDTPCVSLTPSVSHSVLGVPA